MPFSTWTYRYLKYILLIILLIVKITSFVLLILLEASEPTLSIFYISLWKQHSHSPFFLFLHCTSLLSTFKLRGSNAPQTINQFHKSNGYLSHQQLNVFQWTLCAQRSSSTVPHEHERSCTHTHTHTHTQTQTPLGATYITQIRRGRCSREVEQGKRGEERKWTEKSHLKYSPFRSVHLPFYVFWNFINIRHDYVCVFICPLKDFFGLWDYNASCV